MNILEETSAEELRIMTSTTIAEYTGLRDITPTPEELPIVLLIAIRKALRFKHLETSTYNAIHIAVAKLIPEGHPHHSEIVRLFLLLQARTSKRIP